MAWRRGGEVESWSQWPLGPPAPNILQTAPRLCLISHTSFQLRPFPPCCSSIPQLCVWPYNMRCPCARRRFHASMGRLADERARASDVTSEGHGGRGPWHLPVAGVLAARIRGPDLGDSEGGGVAKLLQILSSSFPQVRDGQFSWAQSTLPSSHLCQSQPPVPPPVPPPSTPPWLSHTSHRATHTTLLPLF